jgi:putative glycosyltransferase (TIGR04372 family)
LGDFLTRGIFAAAVKMHFDNAHLTFYYRDDRPYKKDLVAINPYIDQEIVVTGDRTTALDQFDISLDRAPRSGSLDFRKLGISDPDIVLTPSMMRVEDLLRFDRYPVFRMPEAQVPELSGRLIDLGLDPHRWFCCLFYRQQNYRYRGATAYRDVDDRPFEALARYVIEELDGQVVRIGDPNMRSFDLGPGFVDLSRLTNEFMVQAMAVSRARFMVGTNSGPSHLPGAFDVPYVITNTLSIWLVWTPAGKILPYHLIDSAGVRVDVKALLDLGIFDQGSIRNLVTNRGCTLAQNTFEELRQTVNLLHAQTSDCRGWRPNGEAHRPPAKNRIDFLQPYRQPVTVLRFPTHGPKS